MENIVADAAPAPEGAGQEGQSPEGMTAAEIKKWKVKVDNEELEVDEQELLKGYAHNKAAARRMDEATRARQEAMEALQLMRNNPREALQRLGIDLNKFSNDYINEQLQEAMLTPEQKKARDMERELQQWRQLQKQAQEQLEQQALAEKQQALATQIEEQMTQALQASKLPKNAFTVGRIAHYLRAAWQAGYKDATPQDVIGKVRAEYNNDMKSLLSEVPEEALEELLGPDILRRIAKTTVKGQKAMPVAPKAVNANKPARDKGKQKGGFKDFFKQDW